MVDLDNGWCELLEFWDNNNNKPVKVMVCFDEDDPIIRDYEVSKLVKRYESKGMYLIGAKVSGAVDRIILFTTNK